MNSDSEDTVTPLTGDLAKQPSSSAEENVPGSSSAAAARALIHAYSSRRLSTRRLPVGCTDPAASGECASSSCVPQDDHRRVWGWLEPGTRVLPHILLHGPGVELGRGSSAVIPSLQRMASLGRGGSGMSGVSDSGSVGGGNAAAAAVAAAGGGDGGSVGNGGGDGNGRQEGATSAASARRSTVSTDASGTIAANRRFVPVPDGRVSALHCVVSLRQRPETGEWQAHLQDTSSNGTFLNGERVPGDGSAWLVDGDRVSLVLSVSPLAEQYFVYRKGDPREVLGSRAAKELFRSDSRINGSSKRNATEAAAQAAAAGLTAGGGGGRGQQQQQQAEGKASGSAGGARSAGSGNGGAGASTGSGAGGGGGKGSSAARLMCKRSATSKYLSADVVSCASADAANELTCPICLSGLAACVALQPCGHNFCAACLSQHFAAALGNGQPLTCPLRCAAPERVVINQAVRDLAATRRRQQQRGGDGADPKALKPAAAAASTAAQPILEEGEGEDGAGGGGEGGGGGDVPGPGVAASKAQGRDAQGGVQGGAKDGALGQQAGEREQAEEEPVVGEEEDADPLGSGMSPLCPLSDELLPLVTADLADRQVDLLVARLTELLREASCSVTGSSTVRPVATAASTAAEGDAAGLADVRGDGAGPGAAAAGAEEEVGSGGGGARPLPGLRHQQKVAECLDALMTCLTNGAPRTEEGDRKAIEAVVEVLRLFAGCSDVACNACIALGCLLQVSEEPLAANVEHAIDAGALAALRQTMRADGGADPMVQLTAIIGLLPFQAGSPELQVRIAEEMLPDVIAALRRHHDQALLQGHGLMLLGTLAMGDDACLDDVRRLELSLGAGRVISRALTHHCHDHELVMAGCMVAIAALMDEAQDPAVLDQLAAAGVPYGLRKVAAEYKMRWLGASHENDAEDASTCMQITTACEMMAIILAPASRRVLLRRLAVAAAISVPLVGVAAAVWWARARKASPSSS